MTHKTILISTLGGQAQVVTFALDALLARDEPIAEVIALHFSPEDPRVRKALAQLHAEFATPRYAAISWCPVVISNQMVKLHDIRDEADAQVAWQAVRELLTTLKARGCRLHFCVAGGRRIVGLLAMFAAMLHFDFHDRLWHLYTPREVIARAYEGALMHTDAARLIQIPLMPWGMYFPGLRAMTLTTPDAVLAAQQQMLTPDERARCQQVWDRLTDRQREVVHVFATGLTPQEVAERLVITLATVNTHKTHILAECRNAWGLELNEWLDYHFLAEKFEVFCDTH